MKRRNPQLVLLVLALGVAVVRLATPSAADPCGPGTDARVVDGALLCTHGADAPPPGVDTTALPTTEQLWVARYGEAPPVRALDASVPVPSAATRVACIGDGTSGPRVQVVYARTESSPDRLPAVAPLLRQYAADADDAINRSAGQRGEGRRIRFVTRDCEVDVLAVALPDGAEESFATMRAAMQAKGVADPQRKYLVFMDAAVGLCGLGEVYPDERTDSGNRNNLGAMYTRIDTSCWSHAATHELLHTLGGVQAGAPNTTGIGHCTDEKDVMCYVDAPTTTTFVACAGTVETQVDCNHDDYFNPKPAEGSYLDTHWNTADNQYLEVAAAPPAPVTGDLGVPGSVLAGTAWNVSANLEIPAGRSVTPTWSVTRSDCRVAAPHQLRTKVTCPVTVGGAVEVLLQVSDSAGQNSSFSRRVSFDTPRSPRATDLSLRVSDSRVRRGDRVRLRGVLSDAADGRRIARMPVVVWALRKGDTAWREVARPVTNWNGRFTYRVRPRSTTVYFARSLATTTWQWGTAPERTVTVRR